MKKLCLLLACILGLSTVTMASVQAKEITPPIKGVHHREGMHGPNVPPPDFSKLKLTKEQKDKLDEHRKANREKMAPIIDQMEKDRVKIGVIKSSKTLTDEQKVQQILALKKELRELRRKSNVLIQEDAQYFQSILTDKQKKTYDKMMKDHMKQMEKARKSGKYPARPNFPSNK